MQRTVPAGPVRLTLADLAELLKTAPKPDRGYAKAVRRAIQRQGKLPKSTRQS